MLEAKIKRKRGRPGFTGTAICCCVAALSLLSCEQSLNIDITSNDRRLLVDGEFTNDTTVQSIRLSCSGSITTGRPQAGVSGARIFITDNVDTMTYVESIASPGFYQTPAKCFGIGGHTYTLHISNVDIDGDGRFETYTAQAMMPVPVRFDSMTSVYGMNGDQIKGTICNTAYCTTSYNGPDYLYTYPVINSVALSSLSDDLGNGDLTKEEPHYRIMKVNSPGSVLHGWVASYIEPQMRSVADGDTITFVGLDFNKDQYEFLKEFDNSTPSGNVIQDNLYDQLTIPANLPTNIEPSDKAAGYFFIYSVSRISTVFRGSK